MKVILVLVSGLYMFIIGNMTKWLMPYLQSKGIPDWVYDNVVFYSILYTAAAGLNVLFLKRFVDDSELNATVKDLRSKLSKGRKTHQRQLQEECNALNQQHEIKVIALSCRIKELEAEVSQKESLIKELGGNLLLQINKTTMLRTHAPRKYNEDSLDTSSESDTYDQFIAQRSKDR